MVLTDIYEAGEEFGRKKYGLTDRTQTERLQDYGLSIISFGIPNSIHLADSIDEMDYEEIAYWLALELVTIGTYTGMLALANLLDPKNALPLKQVHQLVNLTRMFIVRGALAMAPFATFAGMAAYGQGVRKSITAISDIYAQAGLISIGPGKRSGWSQIRGRR